jgi:hypothetical protein
MLLAEVFDGQLLTAVGALLTGIGGCLVAWSAVITARRRANDECQDKLKIAHAESEELADELHKLRMQGA